MKGFYAFLFVLVHFSSARQISWSMMSAWSCSYFSYPALTETWYGKSFDKIENKRSRLYKQSTSFVFVVPLTGLEPVRSRPRGIFLLLYVAIAARIGRCSLDFIFTLDIFLRCAPSSLYTFLEGEPLRLRSVLSPMGEFHRI